MIWLPGRRQQTARVLALCAWLFTALAGRSAETPITPNASREAQSLLSYLADIYGKKILSGQQDGWHGTNASFELDYLTNATGKLPALLGLDFITCTDQASPRDTQHVVVNIATDWYANRNGIVTFCWHWYAPLGETAFYTKDTKFDLTRGLTAGTPEQAALLRDLDAVADELKRLRDARVPVLWRPMHEVNGRWFWWGAQGPEPYKKLWRLMFDRFTYQHGLTNLLWVFSPGAETDLAEWYPGDDCVDLIGQDHYPMDGNRGPAKDVFDELVALGRGAKLVGMSENGPVPDLDRMEKEKARWLFFTTWAGKTLTQNNSREQLIAAFSHPSVLNLGDLPNLKTYPFPAAGKPTTLAFPVPPGDVAVGGVRRLPVIVAVQDENGRIVRNGRFLVTLALADNSNGATLAGTLTIPTINGIATFPDLKLDRAGSYTFRASAAGLHDVTGPVFQSGPGTGIQREWWSNAEGTRPADAGTGPATGREILGKAFETPGQADTNFTARFRGYLLPPQSGAYVFAIANEALSELWLSTDARAANQVKIAEVIGSTPYSKWPHTHESFSAPVTLEAGRRYYLEVRQRQPNGPTHLAVRWRLPDGVEQRPIPGSRLALPDPEDSESGPMKKISSP